MGQEPKIQICGRIYVGAANDKSNVVKWTHRFICIYSYIPIHLRYETLKWNSESWWNSEVGLKVTFKFWGKLWNKLGLGPFILDWLRLVAFHSFVQLYGRFTRVGVFIFETHFLPWKGNKLPICVRTGDNWRLIMLRRKFVVLCKV